MRKIGAFTAILLLVATFCYAQSARNPSFNYEGKSNFANISAGGLEVSGNPGYLEMTGTDPDGTAIVYYLWVDDTGDLRIASNLTISAFASFPTGDWTTDEMDVGTVVGSQS